ncbi:MAG: lytic transglycosylase domain-containing protein [Actinomycetota bacterium]
MQQSRHDKREAAERPREAADRMWAVAAGSMGLTSLVTVALLGAAGAASGQDVAQVGGGEASAAGVDACPGNEAGGGGASTDQAPEPCPDPDQADPGGTEPPPDPAPQPDSSLEPDPTQPPADDDGTDPEYPATGGPQGSGDQGAAGPGGRGGRAHGGRHGGEEGDGNGSGGVAAGGSGHEPRGHESRGAGSAGAGAAPTVADFAPAAISVPSTDLDGLGIPSFLVPIYQQCGDRYGIPWEVLAAINHVETAFGSNLNVSSAGAVGWMQFLPSTWSAYGVDASHDGRRNPYDPEDAICAAGRYLRAAGGQEDLRRAIFAYNHADWYVDLVLGYARQYAAHYLPDPLPHASRLDREFARSLARISRENEVDWAKVLAVLRARGDKGETPAAPDEVRTVARRLSRAEGKDNRRRLVRRRVFRGPGLEQQVPAPTRYNRAVGLPGLVKGLNAVKDRLEQRVLDSERIDVYDAGRQDIAAGRIDVRVLTLLLYLAEKYDGVTVTSLVTGHGYYARPGVPSMHAFGRAVDIAALRGVPILGNQEPGGITEQALNDILLLPEELQPEQLISLFDLGGPSFAAADHDDHIHAGF